MEITIKNIDKKDYGKAIQFAITGMHFGWYFDNELLLKIFGRYFWYKELISATRVIAAYAGDDLAGVLLANIKGDPKKHRPFWESLYVRFFDFLQNTFYKEGGSVYNDTNKELFERYSLNNSPDGEILFLAANPEPKIKGIGSRLLSELGRTVSGKKLYLFTDSACTYQFYDHRGFELACEKDVVFDNGNKKIPLRCMLYSKVFE